MDLQNFMSAFPQGFQHNNRFTCKIYASVALENQLASYPDYATIQYWLHDGLICDTTRLPSRALDIVPLTLYGVSENFPVKTEYTPLECTFLTPLVGARNILPEFFTLWLDQIQSIPNGMESGRDLNWPQNYYGSVELTTYDKANRKSLTYYFENVYPKSMEGIQVSWSEQSEMTKLSVTFMYSTWKISEFDSTQQAPIVRNTPPNEVIAWREKSWGKKSNLASHSPWDTNIPPIIGLPK